MEREQSKSNYFKYSPIGNEAWNNYKKMTLNKIMSTIFFSNVHR